MYKSGANNVYIGSNGNGEWNPTSSISGQKIIVGGSANLYYKLQGTEYASTENSFTLKSQTFDVSSVYQAGQREAHSHYRLVNSSKYTISAYTYIDGQVWYQLGTVPFSYYVYH